MKKIFYKLFGALFAILLMTSVSQAWMTDSKDYLWNGEHVFQHDVTTNAQRTIPLFLSAGMQDGGSDLDEGSTPTLGEVDNVPALVWDDSTESTAAQWTFRLPPDFVAGEECGVYAIVSSDDATGSNIALDYAWWVNNDDVVFDATKISEELTWCTSTSLDVSNEILDLSAGSTAIAAFTQGTWITFEVYNASTGAGDTTEIKGLEFYYQSNAKQ